MRGKAEAINGVLLLDKPSGLGSTAALARVKRLLGASKAGHTGTLDPMASGLLPICLGAATRLAEDLLDADKTYEAVLQLGEVTDTGDSEGQVMARRPVTIEASAIEPILARFRGPIQQIPPMYSAIKRDGRPLYDYARAGQIVERLPRSVTIHQLEQQIFAGSTLGLRVKCSKGTYIRTLAEDLGTEMGCGAHLIALRRTRVADLDIAEAISLAGLEALDLTARRALIQPIDRLLRSVAPVLLNAVEARRFLHGQRLRLALPPPRELQRVSVYEAAQCEEHGSAVGGMPRLLGLAMWRIDGVLVPQRVIAES